VRPEPFSRLDQGDENMNIESTPGQRVAMSSLKKALTYMEARGLGVDAIAFVLDQTFPGICIEIGGGTFERTWHRKSDRYYFTGPGGRIPAAQSAILPPSDGSKT
jgi:hypothetical protein